MTGLLRNNFYAAAGSAKIIIFLLGMAGAGLLITGNAILFVAFALSSATLLSLNAASSIRKESATKWNKYVLTTPVKRKDIIKSRYISHTLYAMAGIAIPFVFVIFAILIHGNNFFYYEVRDPVAMFSLGLGIALFWGAFFYPAVYFFGTDKNEIMILISLLAAAGVTFGITAVLNAKTGSEVGATDFEFYSSIAIYMGAAFLSFILSYFVTVHIYKNKEY